MYEAEGIADSVDFVFTSAIRPESGSYGCPDEDEYEYVYDDDEEPDEEEVEYDDDEDEEDE